MKIGLLCVLVSFVALSVGSALNESLTFDEVFYLEEGRNIYQSRMFADPYNPPLSVLLSGLPSAMGLTSSIYARMVPIVLGVFLVLAVYRTGGILAAILVAFEPTVLAHSHLVTTDIAATLFIFLAILAWLRLLRHGSDSNVLLVGLATGYALASKMTALPYLAVGFIVSLWVRRMGQGVSWLVRRRIPLAGSTVVALFVIWASYAFTFDVVIRPRPDAGRVSERLIAVGRERNIPLLEPMILFLQTQPIPLGTYIATIKNNALRLGKPAGIFFDGQLYERARWHFMPINVLRKIPIPFLVMIAVGFLLTKKRQIRMMAIIGLGIIGAASLAGTVPLVRLVLPAIPFLAVAAASGIREIGEIGGMWGKVAITIVLLWYISGALRQYPHFISYANGLAGPREKRYEALSDSNLDWGQALPDLARYIRNNNIGKLQFSYFGRDDGALYSLSSQLPYGSWKFEEICAFHEVTIDPQRSREAAIISVSNWYSCGYNTIDAYRKENLQGVVADSLLVF